jgi:peptidoglycan/LPS O-acetylase OafA/YrhL
MNPVQCISPAMCKGTEMSYLLYLWHFPLFVLAALACGRMPMVEYQQIPLLMKAAVVATSLALSYFTYVCVERPLRSSPRTGQIAFILGAAMLACGAAVYLTSR